MDIKILIPFAAIAHFILGLLVFRRDRRNDVNISFAFFAWVFAGWSLTLYFYEHPYIFTSLFWIKVVYLFVIGMIGTILYFSFVFPIRKIRFLKLAMLLFGLFLIPLVWVLFLTDSWVKEVILKPWGYETTLGNGFKLFQSIISIFSIWIFYNLIRGYKLASGIRRLQTKYMLLGLIILTILIAPVTILLPLLTGESRYFWLSPIFSLVFVGTTTYAIARHRLMDIRLVVKKGLVYFTSIVILMSLLTLGFYFIENVISPEPFDWYKTILGVILFSFGLLIFNRLLNFIDKLVDRYLFRTLFTSRQAIEELTKKTTTIIELPRLIDAITDTIMKSMGLNRAGVLLLDPKTDNYQVSKVVGFTEANGISLVRSNYLTQKLSQAKKSVILQELEVLSSQMINGQEKADIEKLKTNMKRIEASLCLPLIIKNRLIGIIVLGDKISNEAYTKEDLDLLQTLVAQTAVGIENAKLYQQVQNFNKTLQDKVDEQTKDIKAKNIQLQKLLNMRSEFLTIASHQLRTPVSVIRGITSMFKEGDLDKLPEEEKKRFIGELFRRGNKLEQIINDILYASEMDTEPYKLTPKSPGLKQVQIEEMIEEIINSLQFEAKEKDLILEYHKAKTILPKIMADDKFLNEAVNNIVENAVKYTPSTKKSFDSRRVREIQGRVEVETYQQNGNIVIKVSDNGIGIPKEDLPKLFNKFARAKNAVNMYTDGTGLGLFITKQIIEGHKGTIRVESEINKGTTFYITLPIKPKF